MAFFFFALFLTKILFEQLSITKQVLCQLVTNAMGDIGALRPRASSVVCLVHDRSEPQSMVWLLFKF